jgi:hypothetical protein
MPAAPPPAVVLQRTVVANMLMARRAQVRELEYVALGAASAGGKSRLYRVAHVMRVPAAVDEPAATAAFAGCFDETAKELLSVQDVLSPG